MDIEEANAGSSDEVFETSEGFVGEGQEENLNKSGEISGKVDQEQIHGLLFGDQLSWQAIIYDLINTEQLDPWDVDLVLLTNKYLEKIRELEEANFFVSSKVLLAAALLLRIKSEILLHKYIPTLDEILFGTKEEKKYVQERIELDDEIPDLVPRTPLPRFRKVTLEELMAALGKAITTENRRIRRVVTIKQQELETALSLPKSKINLKDRIQDVHKVLKEKLSHDDPKIAFSALQSGRRDDQIATFVPLLHLDVQHKVVLEQEIPFDEIWVWLKDLHNKHHADVLEAMRKEVEEAMKVDALKEKVGANEPAEEDEEGYTYEDDGPEEEETDDSAKYAREKIDIDADE